MYREVFSDAIRARLKPGMTTNEVIAILGVPSGAKTISRAIRGKDPRATVFSRFCRAGGVIDG
jgi:hypothetical protein